MLFQPLNREPLNREPGIRLRLSSPPSPGYRHESPEFSKTKTNMFVATLRADFNAELAEGAENEAFSPRSPRAPRFKRFGAVENDAGDGFTTKAQRHKDPIPTSPVDSKP